MWVEEGAGCPQVNKSERLMVTWGPSKAVNINKLMAILVTILKWTVSTCSQYILINQTQSIVYV